MSRGVRAGDGRAVDKVFDGGIPGPGLVATSSSGSTSTTVSAIVQSWARGDADIPASTVYGWATAMGHLAQPVADAIRYKAVVEAHATRLDDRVVVDGPLVTSQGPGSAFEFALELARELAGPAKITKISPGMILPRASA